MWGGDSVAIVGHGDKDFSAPPSGLHPDDPLPVGFSDGLFGIVEKIEQYLLHLLRRDQHRIGNLAGLGNQLDVIHAKLVALQVHRLFDEFVDADDFPLFRFLAAEGEKVLHQVGCPLRLLDDGVDGSFIGRASPAEGEQLRMAENGSQRVIDFMGDAGDGFPERRELFGLDEVALQAFLLRQVDAQLDGKGGQLGQQGHRGERRVVESAGFHPVEIDQSPNFVFDDDGHHQFGADIVKK